MHAHKHTLMCTHTHTHACALHKRPPVDMGNNLHAIFLRQGT